MDGSDYGIDGDFGSAPLDVAPHDAHADDEAGIENLEAGEANPPRSWQLVLDLFDAVPMPALEVRGSAAAVLRANSSADALLETYCWEEQQEKHFMDILSYESQETMRQAMEQVLSGNPDTMTANVEVSLAGEGDEDIIIMRVTLRRVLAASEDKGAGVALLIARAAPRPAAKPAAHQQEYVSEANPSRSSQLVLDLLDAVPMPALEVRGSTAAVLRANSSADALLETYCWEEQQEKHFLDILSYESQETMRQALEQVLSGNPDTTTANVEVSLAGEGDEDIIIMRVTLRRVLAASEDNGAGVALLIARAAPRPAANAAATAAALAVAASGDKRRGDANSGASLSSALEVGRGMSGEPGVVTEWDDKLVKGCQVPKSEAVGKSCLKHSAGDCQKIDEDALADAGAPSVEVRLRRGDGTLTEPLVVNISARYNPKSEFVGWLCIGQIESEPSVVELAAPVPQPAPAPQVTRTQQSSGILGQRDMVLHDIRSPLHGIIGLADTLSQDDTPHRTPLKMIGASAERVLETITSLVDYWSLSEDNGDFTKTDMFDIGMMIKNVVDQSEQTTDKRGKPMKKKDVEIVQEIARDMPAVRGDQQMLSQALYHVIVNALKFTAKGHVRICVAPDPHEPRMNISVEDTGIGIPANTIGRIWEPFAQEDSSENRKYEGIGLGLAITREVFRLHGGAVRVNSVHGKGSTFYLELPFRPTPIPRQTLPAPGPAPEPERSPTPEHHRQPQQPELTRNDSKVILSVDDDRMNQQVICAVLEPCGYKIVVCMSGKECLDYMADKKNPMPDLLLLDLMMPGIDGFGVLKELRKTYALEDMTIVMISAKGQASSVVKGFELGCTDWVHKPFDRQEFVMRVRTHLQLRSVIESYHHSMARDGSKGGSLPRSVEKESSRAISGGATSPAARPAEIQIFTKPIETTALYVVIGALAEGDGALGPLFAAFEAKAELRGVMRTDIVGTCYLAIALGGGDPPSAARLLQLALDCLDLLRRGVGGISSGKVTFGMGLHSETNLPPVIAGKPANRQYPSTCFFGRTVLAAKRLAEMAENGRIITSGGLHKNLGNHHAAMDAEIAHRYLRLARFDGGPMIGECICLAPEGMAPPVNEHALAMAAKTKEEEPEAVRAQLQSLENARREAQDLQMQLQAAQQEIQALRSAPTPQVGGGVADGGGGGVGACVGGGGSGNQLTGPTVNADQLHGGQFNGGQHIHIQQMDHSSLVRVMRQNAHLCVLLNYYYEQLGSAKEQLQAHSARGVQLERKLDHLSEKNAHLELDNYYQQALRGVSPLQSQDSILWNGLGSSAFLDEPHGPNSLSLAGCGGGVLGGGLNGNYSGGLAGGVLGNLLNGGLGAGLTGRLGPTGGGGSFDMGGGLSASMAGGIGVRGSPSPPGAGALSHNFNDGISNAGGSVPFGAPSLHFGSSALVGNGPLGGFGGAGLGGGLGGSMPIGVGGAAPWR